MLTLEEATKPMRTEATAAGFFKSPWGNHPRIQILRIEQLLGGEGIDYPHMGNITFRRAPRAQATEAEQLELPGAPSPGREKGG